MWSSILIFKVIVLRLVIYSASDTILEQFGHFFYRLRVHVIWVPKLKIGLLNQCLFKNANSL